MDGSTATQINFAIARSGNLDSIPQTPQKPAPTEKLRFSHPPKMLRLKRGPVLCFQSLATHFNRTLVAIKKNAKQTNIEGKKEPKTHSRACAPMEPPLNPLRSPRHHMCYAKFQGESYRVRNRWLHRT
jgi:hypothetical protein